MDKQYCRVCSRSEDLCFFPLTTISQISDVKVEDMLIYCTQLEVTNEDSLPQQICSECLAALNLAFVFRKLCYRSDITLRKMLNDSLQDADSDMLLTAPNFEPLPFCTIPEESNVSQITIKEEPLEPEYFLDSIVEASEMTQDPQFKPFERCQTSDKNVVYDFICNDCNYRCNRQSNFKRHLRILQHTALKMTSKRNRSQDSRKSERVRRTLKMFKCEDCGHENSHSANFKRHQAIWHHNSFTVYRDSIASQQPLKKKGKDQMCPHCGKKIPSTFSMATHIRLRCTAVASENKNSEINTDTSSVNVSQSNEAQGLVKHPIYIKTGRKLREEYQCQLCPKSVTSKHAYNFHMMKHARDSESNPKSTHFAVKCDFCDYYCPSKNLNNLLRHRRTKCKGAAYSDETVDPNVFVNDTLKRVINDAMEIHKLTLEFKEVLFPMTIETSRPPHELIDSISEFDNVLVLKMRGIRCCGCSMFFEDEEALTKHREITHPTSYTPYASSALKQCVKCYQKFYRQESLDHHRQVASSDKILFCITCEQVMGGNTAWFYHCLQRHGRKIAFPGYDKIIVGDRFRCCNCDFLVATQTELDEHIASVHATDRLPVKNQCDKCFKQFMNKHRFDKHLEMRSAKRFYRCFNKKCQMEFKLEREIIDHVCIVYAPSTSTDVDDNNKPAPIIYCGFKNCKQSFQTRVDFQNHMDAVHNEQSNLVLPKQMSEENVCDPEFTNKKSLKLHDIAKNSQHKFLSKVCGKDTGRKGSLKNQKGRGQLRAHVLTHAKADRYACRFCCKPNETLLYQRLHEKKCPAKDKSDKKEGRIEKQTAEKDSM